ncbi:MAG: hypothetical protein OXU20_34630 [Myxococcales bacterium]|nr:hypothetical protein [Myxococcales bacterium]
MRPSFAFLASWTSATLVALCAGACEQRFELLRPAEAGDPAREDAGRPDAGETAPEHPRCGRCPETHRCAQGTCISVAGIRSLASHFSHTCYLDDGHLLCFGRNSAGQLGLGNHQHKSAPTQVGEATDWLRVTVGEESTCGLRAPGRLYCWGHNAYGQLGHDDTDDRTRPARVGQHEDWSDVACGGWSCCGVRAGGSLYCWGANLEGKPGQDDAPGSPDVLAPAAVAGVREVVHVSNGQGHVCVIDTDGDLYCWGRNSEGQTGTGPTEEQPRTPVRVQPSAPPATGWASVSAGQHHSCAVTDEGALYCWGDNHDGETGIPGLGEVTVEPTRVGVEDDWRDVAVGGFHSCGLKHDGRLACWGRAREGQLGLGGEDRATEPAAVTPAARWRSLALGPFHSCALSEQQTLYCWGANDYGQLGVGDDERRDMPTLVADDR